MNDFFKIMLESKKKNLDQFQYKGQIYEKGKTKNGLVIYRKKKIVN